jgi:hypothetical protein
VSDAQGESDGLPWVRDAEHERVSDRLHMRPAPRRELFANGVEQLGYQVRGLFVAVSLGQGGVAGDVGEQEGGARRVRRRCGRPALVIVRVRYLLSVLPALERDV